MLKWGGKGLLTVCLVLLVLAVGNGDSRPSTLDLTVDPYRYNLVRWEVSHFLDKWVHKLADLMPLDVRTVSRGAARPSQSFLRPGPPSKGVGAPVILAGLRTRKCCVWGPESRFTYRA